MVFVMRVDSSEGGDSLGRLRAGSIAQAHTKDEYLAVADLEAGL